LFLEEKRQALVFESLQIQLELAVLINRSHRRYRSNPGTCFPGTFGLQLANRFRSGQLQKKLFIK
jgi:hypothetical protein